MAVIISVEELGNEVDALQARVVAAEEENKKGLRRREQRPSGQLEERRGLTYKG